MANIVEFSDFEDKLFKIYPSGNKRRAFEELENVLDDPSSTLKNNDGSNRRLTFDDICERYQSYIKYWNDMFAEKASRGYLSSKDEKKDIFEFLFQKMYQKEYVLLDKNPVRSEYLFGKDKEKLYRDFNYFKNFVLQKKGTVPVINDIPPKREIKEIVEPKEDIEIKPNLDADISMDISLDENEGEDDPF